MYLYREARTFCDALVESIGISGLFLVVEEIEVKPKVLMFYKNLIIVGVGTGKLLVKDFFGQCCDVEILEHSLWDVKCRICKGTFCCSPGAPSTSLNSRFRNRKKSTLKVSIGERPSHASSFCRYSVSQTHNWDILDVNDFCASN